MGNGRRCGTSGLFRVVPRVMRRRFGSIGLVAPHTTGGGVPMTLAVGHARLGDRPSCVGQNRPGGVARHGIGWFVGDEGGYTTVAIAVSLLVSISLVFGVATTEWMLARSADVQAVADATSIAGSNVVSSYCTIAQVADACVLSMGLVGISVLGAGLVVAAIPGAQEASAKVVDVGKDILNKRRSFAKSAAKGLKGLEKALPVLVVSAGSSCARANAEGSLSYTGAAIPLPLQSQTDFSGIEDDVDGDDLADAAERLRDATRQAEEAKRRADDARRRAWEADCVDSPSCLSSRAASLAGMQGWENPVVSTPEEWTFGMPIERARTYYQIRWSQESPVGEDIESVADSLAREMFYDYALGEVLDAYYYESGDGSVDLMLPHLARNSSEVRETWMYTNAAWPCTDEEGLVLHATLSCPNALGEFCGFASVADIENGGVRECGTCRMSVGDLGRVASISTSATNGFEHYWQIIVEESQDYRKARNEQAEAERLMKEIADEGKQAFDAALDQLRIPRPKLCPPGAYGCVGVVARGSGAAAPSRLVDSFLSGQDLPAGATVSASALAPDATDDGKDVLSSFFDGVAGKAGGGFSVGGMVDGIFGLWGRLLVAYGSSYDSVEGAVGGFLDGVDGVFGGTVGSWLKQKLKWVVDAAGFAPADMRARKPVLTNTGNVLGRAGFDKLGKARSLVQSIPVGADAAGLVGALGIGSAGGMPGSAYTIAELPIPGTGVSVPLTVDLSRIGG